jgi:hypothetical protein
MSTVALYVLCLLSFPLQLCAYLGAIIAHYLTTAAREGWKDGNR